MLWILKRAPKTYAKNYGYENIYNFTQKFLLPKPVNYYYLLSKAK